MSTLKEIANALCAYKEAKNNLRLRKEEVQQLAIRFGLSPTQKQDARVFLDGYLIGQGMHEAWREVEEPESAECDFSSLTDEEMKRLSDVLTQAPGFELPESI